MSTAELKTSIINKVGRIENDELLSALDLLLNNHVQEIDWWKIINKSERDAIDEGIKQADSGKLIPHEVVMEELRTRYHV